MMWAAANSPQGWLSCNGQAVSRLQFAELFSAIGTQYGIGDGSTTFNVPNFQGVVPRGTGSQVINARTKTGPALGAAQEDQLQGHVHPVTVTSVAATANAAITSGGYPQPGAGAANSIATNFLGLSIGSPSNDGSNGVPRTGAETRVSAVGINFIIKA